MIALLGAITLGVAAALYVALAMGFPLGEFAMGGKYKVLPAKMRLVCAALVLVQLFAIAVIL